MTTILSNLEYPFWCSMYPLLQFVSNMFIIYHLYYIAAFIAYNSNVQVSLRKWWIKHETVDICLHFLTFVTGNKKNIGKTVSKGALATYMKALLSVKNTTTNYNSCVYMDTVYCLLKYELCVNWRGLSFITVNLRKYILYIDIHRIQTQIL